MSEPLRYEATQGKSLRSWSHSRKRIDRVFTYRCSHGTAAAVIEPVGDYMLTSSVVGRSKATPYSHSSAVLFLQGGAGKRVHTYTHPMKFGLQMWKGLEPMTRKLSMTAAIVLTVFATPVGIGTADAYGGHGGGGFHGGDFRGRDFRGDHFHDRGFDERRDFPGDDFRLGRGFGCYPGYYGYGSCYLTVYGTTACY